MKIENMFLVCPECGARDISFERSRLWRCGSCGFTYYHNTAAAVALIILIDGKILMETRAKDPRKNMLALPGGFIEPGERAEDAAVRECAEETGARPEDLKFLCTFPNTYEYKGVLYNTCDIFFTASLSTPFRELRAQKGEVNGFSLLNPRDVADAPIAFEATKKAILLFNDLTRT